MPQVAPGSDVTAALLRDHLRADEPITVIGLRPGHLAVLSVRCGFGRTAHYQPPFGFEHQPEAMRRAVDFVLANPARFVLLAVGSPRQEQLAAAIAATGRATGTGLCIGASLEFLSGAARRAPRWMRRAGLEWLHRLAADPRDKFRRYVIDSTPVLRLLLHERFTAGARLAAPEAAAAVHQGTVRPR